VDDVEMTPSAEARPDVVMKTPQTVRREAAVLFAQHGTSGLACVFRRAVPLSFCCANGEHRKRGS
jgi:hypothetical protein